MVPKGLVSKAVWAACRRSTAERVHRAGGARGVERRRLGAAGVDQLVPRLVDGARRVEFSTQAPSCDAYPKIGGPSAWMGWDLVKNKFWGYEFSKGELDELEAAMASALKSGDLSWDGDIAVNVSQENFQLGAVAATLAELSEELESKGCAMIANVPVEKYSEAELSVLYQGMCAYVGQWVPQSSAGLRSRSRGYGMPLGKIKAEMHGNTPLAGKQANKYGRGPAHFRLHTDRCDVLSLLSIRTAAAGGRSRIASAVTIHDKMLEMHPHLVPYLYSPIPRIWEAGISDLPVWAVHKGKFTTQISPSYIENAQLCPGVRKLLPEELEAIDLLEEIGLEVGHDFLQEPGQMTFLNNHLVYHGRTAWKYEGDQDDASLGRLLFRMWLSPRNSRELPDTPEFRALWGDVRPGAVRGGLEPAVRAGLVEKPNELTDAINSGTYAGVGGLLRPLQEAVCRPECRPIRLALGRCRACTAIATRASTNGSSTHVFPGPACCISLHEHSRSHQGIKVSSLANCREGSSQRERHRRRYAQLIMIPLSSRASARLA
ncbi:unnamed protein product [Prorocentrum cordatum]|uniref:TauD/TfdA-like domain-containing protein n=1 Tax=Prorocentrum cordatum TaxID=2364126 RepID=A0ABN9RH54_9DINO|nr:unnamed protein product [Polarella glacialis]